MAKAGLVCQHLENISRDALERYQAIIRAYVRRRHGVYALYRRGKLYYVGLATNLRSRLKQHLKDRHGKSWDRFSVYLTLGDGHLRELEALLLRIVMPSGNKQLGKFGKAENLKRRLAKDIRALQREELYALMGRTLPKAKLRQLAASEKESPVLAAFLNGKRLRLRARFKSHVFKAQVLNSGVVSFRGRRFNSPSLAAAAVCKRSKNGWWFWRFERSPNEWVHLDELRR